MSAGDLEIIDNSKLILDACERQIEAALESCGQMAERFAVLKHERPAKNGASFNDLSGVSHEGVETPHGHTGYYHDENRKTHDELYLTEKEKSLIDKVIRIWENHLCG